MVDPLIVSQGTLLKLVGMGVPLYSARGLTQTLTPIQAAKVHRRTINGDLIDLSYPQFQKLSSEITCRDIRAPALNGIWPGREIVVYCVAELVYPVGGTPARPERTDVVGSPYTEGAFVRYMPIINMRVMDFSTAPAEWTADVAWKLNLEEV